MGLRDKDDYKIFSPLYWPASIYQLKRHASFLIPRTTNLVFVPINASWRTPYDFFLEYPSEYEDDGRPTKFERTGLGYYICVEVIEETDYGVRCKLKLDLHRLSDWIPYTFGELVMMQPVLTSFSTEQELALPIGKWFTMADDIESHRVQFLFERKKSQQGGAGYPPQSVGSPDP